MSDSLIIAIDNGNKNTKVLGKDGNNMVFSSGFVESEFEPLVKDNLLYYNGKYYQIGTTRFGVQFDKSNDDRCFILTLAAMGHALDLHGIYEGDVILAGGLPISSYSTLKEKFRGYFIRNNLRFLYNKKEFKINIVDCFMFPQGYSAIMSKAADYKDVNAVCIDIGGYSIDVFQIYKGLRLQPESARSYNEGIILLYKSIEQELIKNDIRLDEIQIEDIIRNNKPLLFNDKITETVYSMTERFTNNLLDSLKETYELRVNPCLFIGGGSMLLRPYIENSNRINYTEFLDEYANCRGYQILSKKALAKKDV